MRQAAQTGPLTGVWLELAQASIERTVARMAALGLCPAAQHGVFFGQLLGMADHLTFTLGRSGYRVRSLHGCML